VFRRIPKNLFVRVTITGIKGLVALLSLGTTLQMDEKWIYDVLLLAKVHTV
jgi:hypothetical protein